MKLIKKVIGVDISKDSFTIRFGTLDQELNQSISKAFNFTNNPKGFNQLLKTIGKVHYFDSEDTSSKDIPIWFIMEATGVYYENLAYFLTKNKFLLSVILANKVNNFSKTLDNKSKTDDIDAANQTQYGLEKNLKPWVPPTETFKELKELSREYQSIKVSIKSIKNKLHAKSYSYKANKEIIKRMNQHKKFLEQQVKQVKEQIKKLIDSDSELKERINTIVTIKGVGLMTVVTVVAETNAFALIKNKNQLTSYSGYDIVQNQSGNHTGKTRISKKGNSNIRRAMYMPVLSAVRFNEKLKQFYIRLCKTKANKKIAMIAVARKLLILIYCLWKKNEKFIQNYPNIKTA
ncbi:MAG: IS110 family transposase [Bacteroidota bacterium]|nr:IS110 family transposase [Bacteroidota bacterium]